MYNAFSDFSDFPFNIMLLDSYVAILLMTTSVVTTADDDNIVVVEDVSNGWGEDFAWTPDLATGLHQAQQQWRWVSKQCSRDKDWSNFGEF